MTRLMLTMAACLALGACGAQQQQLVTFTQTDLTNAIKIDTAGLPTTQEKLQCDQWVQSQLNTLQAAIANTPPVTGIFSATSEADAVASNVLASLSPQAQTAFELACGPEITHVVGLVSGFKALQLVAPVAVTTIK